MPRHPAIKIYTDGGARGNPGPAAIGIVVCDMDDAVIKEFGEYIGKATNNQAEYRALIRGLEIAANYTGDEVVCILDSELVVRQMAGKYRIRNEEMRKLAEVVTEKKRSFRNVHYLNQPRMTGHLARADELVNKTLDNLRRPPEPPVSPGITKEAEVGVSNVQNDETPRDGENMMDNGHEMQHEEHGEMTPEEHRAFLERMGISQEEDEEWHRTHEPAGQDAQGGEPVNPFQIGVAFLEFCVMQGWLKKEGVGKTARYYVTEEGKKELRAFGIDLSR